MKPTIYSFIAAAACIYLGTVNAQDLGNVIPFQGQLANQEGQPLSTINPSTLVFRLYRQGVGGIAIWEESQPNISVNAGRFSVLLGSRTELPAAPNFNATLYLGITVDDGNPTTADVEMRPRQALVPVINAAYSRNAEKLQGYDWSVIFGASPPTGSILGSRIAPGTITSDQLAAHTVTAAQIVPSSITAEEIAPSTLTSHHIAKGTITGSEIAHSTVDVAHLVQQVTEALVPPGTIVPFGGRIIPSGWLLCAGSAVSRSQYPRLFTAIEGAWGNGDGRTTFNLPDLRGIFLRGVDAGAARDPDVGSRTSANVGGDRNSVGSYQSDAVQGHNHALFHETLVGAVGGSSGVLIRPANLESQNVSGPTKAVKELTSDGTHGSPRVSTETRPVNAYVHYIIKY